VTLVGLNIAFLVGGAVIVESVFAVPGIGNLMVRGVLQRDFPVVQGVTLCVTLMVIVVSLGTDLVHARLDPRVRLS
jgi:peptide/nickel transport system permease protein